ncbi:helix-turn-helix domain-containing protein [Streptomyces fragilis]|uniref:Helix-turn-helix domain-containing protein n=1 Tax=Streptomyces fragilis TaxID=67301 RepID=A0ABV2YDL2_9ACTN|nr:helix-turn-helix domain-containing protein [Streptomyces fragilis]
MQIHRIPVHDRDFVIIANKAIQDRRLSHTARGILALVLSLPNGIGENVRTLSDDYPQGRGAVAKAVAELRKLGYWVTSTRRDPETGLIRSSVDVYELPGLVGAAALPVRTPAPAASPFPSRPGTGDVATGDAGTSPCGEKEQEKDGGKPSLIPWRRRSRKPDWETGRASAAADAGVKAAAATEEEGAGEQVASGVAAAAGAAQATREAEAARILRRLEAVDPRLRLGERQVHELVPAVCRWLGRGATVAEITEALTQGLPSKLYSARRILADRLERKLPAPRRRWKSYAECGSPGCGSLLPEGQEAGICAGCAVGSVEYFAIDCATGVVTDHAADVVLADGVPGKAPGDATLGGATRDSWPAIPHAAGRVAELRALLRGAAVRSGT